jgi:KUP system potassium uptake protein
MLSVHEFIVDVVNHPPNKIEGDAVFLTSSPNVVPVALAKNIKHNRGVHGRTVLLNFHVEDVPRVPNLEKIQIEKLGGGFHLLVARYGFMEDPKLDTVLTLTREQGLDLNLETTSFFIGHENLILAEKSAMARWRTTLFIFMSRNASDATSFFSLPVDRVIEVGVRIIL